MTAMRPGLSDTNHAVEQIQIALLREAGLVRRVDLAVEMTTFAIDAAYSALRRRHPNLSDVEIRLLFAEQHYGPTLATRLRAALLPQGSGHGNVS